jgi:hypothetical protein
VDLCFSRLAVHAAPILPQLKDRDLRGGDLDDGTSDGQGFPVGFRGKPLECNNPAVHGEEAEVVDRHALSASLWTKSEQIGCRDRTGNPEGRQQLRPREKPAQYPGSRTLANVGDGRVAFPAKGRHSEAHSLKLIPPSMGEREPSITATHPPEQDACRHGKSL